MPSDKTIRTNEEIKKQFNITDTPTSLKQAVRRAIFISPSDKVEDYVLKEVREYVCNAFTKLMMTVDDETATKLPELFHKIMDGEDYGK